MKGSKNMVPQTPIVADLSAIAAVSCPCGEARRSLYREDNGLCTLHQVEITVNATTHYHRDHTEVYYVLRGTGGIELDDETIDVHPGSVVLIPPGVRHRAVIEEGGQMTILNFVVPPFDPDDEWED